MTFLFTVLLMLGIVAAMSVGVLFGRRPLQGSCGGMARLGLGDCEICGGDPLKCEVRSPDPGSTTADPGLYHDATRRDF
ncbi:MAG: (Na+)-NQR maturation NqrM [Gammaproteobacteria bacterium]|nr:(Na+)-NQR maturation NqrM [Gammaproteobacteria bacterium]